AELPVAGALSQACGIEPVVAGRNEMDGRPHQRSLDDGAPLESARQLLTPKAFEARPEPDVPVRRVLVLDPAHTVDCLRDREPRAAKEELAGEQRAIQLLLGECSLCYPTVVTSS